MNITKTLNGDTLTITAAGWIDTLTAPDFHNEIEYLEDAKNVILDLGEVDYISSAGLREIVALYRRITEKGANFSVRKVQSEVMDVFTMTGFNKKIEIRTD